MKLLDAKGRRHWSAPRTPKKTRIEIDDPDIRMFDLADTHGCATTKQLRLVAKTHKKNHQGRCGDLYHGTLDGVYYFERPPEYHKTEDARQQNRVYELSDFARAQLASRGLLSPFIKRYDHRIHRLFAATFGISMELQAPDHGVRYMRRHEVLSKKGNPMQLSIRGGTLVPDDLFGLQYDSGKKRYFAVEIDRANEPIIRQTSDGTSIADKLDGYYEALDKELHRATWGTGMLMVLIATTARDRITGKRGIFSYIKSTRPDLAECFLAKAYPIFGKDWRVPEEPLLEDVYEPWQCADGTMFDITKPSG